MSILLSTAQTAALRGAASIVPLFGKSAADLQIRYKKKDGDTPVTIMDRVSENAILAVIQGAPDYKNDSINAEERGLITKSGSRMWFVDPLDGTLNATFGLPQIAVGIAVVQDGRLQAAVAVDPFNSVMVYAERDNGAFKVKLSYSDENFEIISDAVQLYTEPIRNPMQRIAWVCPFFNENNSARKGGWLAEVHGLANSVRTTGSNIQNSMDLAQWGHIQLVDSVGGYYDIAPGILFAREMGGKFMDLEGREPMPGAEVVIGTLDPKLADPLLESLHKHYGPVSPLGPYPGFRGTNTD